jgi:hypothetical protein
MSSQVVRVQSFSKGSLGGIGKEVEREEKDLLENRNQDIDKSRTHLNEFYKHTENGMYAEFKKVSKDLNISNAENLKKNATAFEGMVITSDKEYFEKLGYVPGQEPPSKVKEFFAKSYEFAKQEIGFKGTDKNILCASVHYDETTPHLQLYYIPVVDSWKEKIYEKDENGKVLKNENGSPIQARDGKGKIIYRDVTDSEERRINRTQFWQNKGGKTSYTQMQDRYYEQMSKEYGLGRGEKGSTREHTTKQEWEQQKLTKEIVAKRKELSLVEKQIDKLKGELEYSKDGSVLVPQLATKTKTAEIQEQNRALKREFLVLQSENSKLKADNDKLRAEQQAQADALKDRGSIHRMSLDALDRQNIYEMYMAKARLRFDVLDKAMKPYEDMIAKAHSVGIEMVQHKKGYVDCLEMRKSPQNDVKTAQERKSTLETNLGEIRQIESRLNTSRFQLEKLEQEKNGYSVLQVLKKRECDKQIKSLSTEIKADEEVLENKFDMKNRTDRISISDEVRWYEGEIRNCVHEINEKSALADNLSDKAKEHLQAYKTIQQSKSVMYDPVKNIIERYDNEYQPPQKYKLALESYNTQGLSRNKTQAKEDMRMTFDEMKQLINYKKANDILSKVDKPKTQIKSQYREC